MAAAYWRGLCQQYSAWPQRLESVYLMMSLSEVVKEIGRKVCFTGNEYVHANAAVLVQAAKRARQLGFDSLCVKKADGGIRYYANVAELAAIKKAVNEQAQAGIFYYAYCYGPRFGESQIHAEAAIQKELAEAEGHGIACADMEVEYNNHAAAAAEFGSLVNLPGWLVTTWADPIQQQWSNVLQALKPHTAAFVPQEYTAWLEGQENQLAAIEPNVLPAVSIWGNPQQGASLARAHHHPALFVWEYAGCNSNPSLTQATLRAFG